MQDRNYYYYFPSATKLSLSNFYAVDLSFKGTQYCSSEQAYQHQKAIYHNCSKLAKDILSTCDARKILWLGKLVKTDISWKGKKGPLMYNILLSKYEQCPEFRAELGLTSTKVLVEDTKNFEGGVGQHGTGHNKLGVQLMELRHKLL